MQIYRKIWHFSFVWAPLAYYHALSRETAVRLSLAAFLLFLLLDLVRLNWRKGNEIAYRYFSCLLREGEKRTLTTAVYFALSCLICALFFERRVAVLSILLLCVGDPVAALVGSRYGSIRILNKSLQGSLACFVVGFLVSLCFVPPVIAFWAALTATFFELISSRLNDNLSIPIFTGLMVTSLLESPELTGPMQYLLIFFKIYLIFVIVTSLVGIGLKHTIIHYYLRHYDETIRRATGSWRPFVSVIKPVRGLEGEDFENFESFCKQDYQGKWEILFVVQDPLDPVTKIVDRLRVLHPSCRIRLVNGDRDPARTDKMNNLIRGAAEAEGEVLVFSDQAARVRPGYLRSLLEPLCDPKVGVVTGVAAYFGARTVPAVLNAHLVNMLGQSLYFALAYFDRLDSANGCTLAIRRRVYEEVGGFEAISDQIADAHALAQAVRRKGYKIHLLGEMIPVCQPRLTFAEWLERAHRLAVLFKTYRPHHYPLFLFQLGFFHALLFCWIFPESRAGPSLAIGVLGAEVASHLRMNYLYVKDRSAYLFIWLLPVVLVLAPFLWMSAYFGRVVAWRGERYFVDRRGIATRLKGGGVVPLSSRGGRGP